MESIEELREFLQRLPMGPVQERSEAEPLLDSCWDHLVGDDGGMQGYKLVGRMENTVWDPPILSFEIERHGGTVMGSSRSEVQSWGVDVKSGTRTLVGTTWRQLRAAQKRLDVQPIAQELFSVIQAGQDDPRIRRLKDGRVQVSMGQVIPGSPGPKQTVVGRRKRLRTALDELMAEREWSVEGPNIYAPPSSG